jgi:hypothetical protein
MVAVPTSAAVAQPDEPRARRLFFEARAAYQKASVHRLSTDPEVVRRDAEERLRWNLEALTKLDQVVAILGKPNQRVLPMLVDVLHRLNEHARAEVAIKAYFALQPPPDPGLSEYERMRSRQASAAQLAAKQRQRYEQAIGPSRAPYDEYLKYHPHGPGAVEVRARWARQQGVNQEKADDAAYAAARGKNTSAAYDEYLRTHPSGRHAAAARVELDRARHREATWRASADDADFAAARKQNTKEAYDAYLRRWPSGRHWSEAGAAIEGFDKADRRAKGERILAGAREHEKKASAERIIGGLKIGGGVVVAAGSVVLLFSQALGSVVTPLIGGAGIGVGFLLVWKARGNFRRARGHDADARVIRDEARPYLVHEPRGPERGAPAAGLAVSFTF